MNSKKVFPKKRIFLADELALVLAFFAALIIRYRSDFHNWRQYYNGLYVSFLIVLCLIQVILFLVYDARRKSLFLMDPVENLFSVIKSRILLIALGLLYLYATQKGTDSSRFVIAAIPVFDIIISFCFRLILVRHYYSKVKGTSGSTTLHLYRPYPNEEELKKAFSSASYDEVLIHDAKENDEELKRIIELAEKLDIRAYADLETYGYKVRPGIVTDIDNWAAIPVSVRNEKFDLFGVQYSVARTEEAVLHVIKHVKELSGKYICFSNVHTSVMAREDQEYRDVLNGAAFVFPDGNPVAKLQQKKGYIGAERVAGPDFMEHMFRNTMDGSVTHYFYGSSENTLKALESSLKENYPGIVIKGLYSPPFRPLSEEEDKADIEMINNSGADIIWIGLGAPKQEKWMRAHEGKIKGVMMGVGAGFDFHGGTIKRAPLFVQKVGLEWLYRLFQDPKRLIGRYFVTNVKFIWYVFVDKLSGKR